MLLVYILVGMGICVYLALTLALFNYTCAISTDFGKYCALAWILILDIIGITLFQSLSSVYWFLDEYFLLCLILTSCVLNPAMYPASHIFLIETSNLCVKLGKMYPSHTS